MKIHYYLLLFPTVSEQWGAANINDGSRITFPVSFSEVSSYVTIGQDVGGSLNIIHCQPKDNSKMMINSHTISGSAASSGIRWLAIGY